MPIAIGMAQEFESHREDEVMLYVKLLVGASAVSAGAWEVWNSPGPWSLMLHVFGALLVSWAIFIAVLYLLAAHLRRSAMRPEMPRPMTPALRMTRSYAAQFKRGSG
jgi:hypothetical protein